MNKYLSSILAEHQTADNRKDIIDTFNTFADRSEGQTRGIGMLTKPKA